MPGIRVYNPAPSCCLYAKLDEIVAILEATKLSFWPFLSSKGTTIFPYGASQDGIVATASDENGAVALEAEFDPVPLLAGNYAYYFDSAANNHVLVLDNATYTHGNASADTAFSMGAWLYMTEALGTARTVLAKYGATANAEEYKFSFDTSGNLVLELHDASASKKETGTGASSVLVPWTWQFVVCTYDGTAATPDVHLYRNGTDTLAAGTTTEDADYIAMEDTASDFLIGCDDATGTPANEFEGYMAMPFTTGQELTAAEVATLYAIGQDIIGL